MYAFYLTGITDFQDMFTTLLSSLERGRDCWVCFFDCLKEKRQFYYYKREELVDFVEGVCKNNNLPLPEIDYFGQQDKLVFEKKYKIKKPQIVFLQNTWHKYPLWYPTAGQSRVVQFAWGQDSLHKAERSKYKVSLNVLRRKEDVSAYQKCGLVSKYFGDLKMESFEYKQNLSTVTNMANKKICYIPESFLRKDSDRLKNSVFVDKLFSFLRDEGFFVVWKKREKGYPKGKWNSPLDYATSQPDLIIEKDLNFPSSILYMPRLADVCVLIGWSSAYHITANVNNNIVILEYKNTFEEEIQKNISSFSRKNTKVITHEQRPSKLLLDFVDGKI